MLLPLKRGQYSQIWVGFYAVCSLSSTTRSGFGKRIRHRVPARPEQEPVAIMHDESAADVGREAISCAVEDTWLHAQRRASMEQMFRPERQKIRSTNLFGVS